MSQELWTTSELFSFWNWREWSVHIPDRFSILNTGLETKGFVIETPDLFHLSATCVFQSSLLRRTGGLDEEVDWNW